MIKQKITDSQLVILLKKEEGIKSYTQLGVLLGMTSDHSRTYVNDVKNGRKKLSPNWKLAIIEKFPKFSGKHLLKNEDEITSKVNEPEHTYSNQIKEKMENYEVQLKYLMNDVMDLKQQVKELIHKQDQLLKGNSEQSEEAV